MTDFWARRPLVLCALTLGVGVYAGACEWVAPIFCAAGLALALAAVCISRSALTALAMAALFAGALCAGLTVTKAVPDEGTRVITARARGDAELRDTGSVRCLLTDVHLDGESLPDAYWTYIPDDNAPPSLPLDGQEVRFTGRIYHPDGQVNPFGFDFRLYLLQKGITYGISGCQDLQISDSARSTPANMLHALRKRVGERMDALFGEQSFLARALLLGDTSELPDDTRAAFARAGLAHVLSVSGLHVGIMLAFCVRALRPLNPTPRGVLLVMTCVMLALCAFLSFQAPVVRASILMFCVLLARVLRRKLDTLSTLSLSFMLILLIRPLELFAPGFQMTFGAMLGIAVIGGRARALVKPVRGRLTRRLLYDYGMSTGASLGVALPVSAHFGSLSVIGVFINPIACVLVAPIMLLCASALLASGVHAQAGALLAAPAQALMRVFMLMTEALSRLPFAAARVQAPPVITTLACIVCALMLSRYVRASAPKRVLIAAGAVIAAIALTQATANRAVRYTQLSVGNADSAIIEDGNTTFVIDTSEYGGDVASYLTSLGREVDVLFLTHLHQDHALGLTQLLADDVPIRKIVLPEGALAQEISPGCLAVIASARDAGIPVEFAARGDEYASERVHITVCWPVAGTVRAGGDANDYSLVLALALDGVTMLSTGDVTGAYEQYAAMDADILKVAHHGSRLSTSETFLAAVSPEAAVLSASGRQNMPSPDVMARLSGTDCYATYETGALSIVCAGGNATFTPYLH